MGGRLGAGACALAVGCAVVLAGAALAGTAGAAGTPRAAAGRVVDGSGRAAGAAPSGNLIYHDGHVVGNVKLIGVVWDSWTYDGRVPRDAGPRTLSTYFTALAASPFVDQLHEYSAAGQSIGRGSFAGWYTIHPAAANNGASVTDAQIRRVVANQIAQGHLPAPTGNRVYVLFFRKGQTVLQGGGDSVHTFCAYHDSVPTPVHQAYFVVMPYQVDTRGCSNGDGNAFDDVTFIAAHEIAETITDPANGGGWWDNQTFMENGDICRREPAVRFTGFDGQSYVVQSEWSNRLGACVL